MSSLQASANRIRNAIFAGVLGLGLASCAQKEGERCEINSDCSSGLRCEVTAGNGICRPLSSSSGSDASTTDAVVTADAGSDTRIDGAADGRVDAIDAIDASDAVDAVDVRGEGDVVTVPDLAPEARPDAPAPDATPDVSDSGADQAGG